MSVVHKQSQTVIVVAAVMFVMDGLRATTLTF